MNESNKKILLVGSVALAGIYAYSSMSGDEDYTSMGGGGGLPLLPELPVDQTGDAASSQNPSTVINIPPLPTPEWAIETPAAAASAPSISETSKKGAMVLGQPASPARIQEVLKLTPTRKSVQAGAIRASGGDLGFGGGWAPGDPTVASQLNKKDRYQKSVATKDVFNWNFADASNNLGRWLLGSKGGITNDPRSPKAATKVTMNPLSKKSPEQLHSSKQYADARAKEAKSRRSRFGWSGYSRMHGGGTPGWKQMGYAKPSAPGQPDRPKTSSKKKYSDGRGGYTSTPGSPD